MNNKVRKAAISYKKAVHGKITLEHAVKYLEGIKYYVRFYSSSDDEILIKYKLSDIAQKTAAFTYNGLAHVVFISNNLSYSEKLHRLLHETGHIVLKHTGTGELYLKNNDEIESEAEAFVYAVLYNKSASVPMSIISILLLLTLLIGCVIGRTIPNSKTASPEEVRTEIQTNADDSATDTVYVTPSGSKYHRADCVYTKDKECTAMDRTVAEKEYTPCAVCQPQYKR